MKQVFFANEEWRQVEFFKSYEVSNLGRIRSQKNNKIIVLKGGIDYSGYIIVSLREGYIQKTKTIHRLIAIAFIPNPENKLTVNHINGIKTDNRVENLEWATYSENLLHAFSTGLKYSHTKISVSQYDQYGRLLNIFPSKIEASMITGVSVTAITASIRVTVKKSRHKFIFKLVD